MTLGAPENWLLATFRFIYTNSKLKTTVYVKLKNNTNKYCLVTFDRTVAWLALWSKEVVKRREKKFPQHAQSCYSLWSRGSQLMDYKYSNTEKGRFWKGLLEMDITVNTFALE